ncbi:MAG TPA: hypothetical protein P5528_07035 [Steroidobacteraceae bacterium]|nr:hypothetical protein [Steroidobacteraceae bacterium]HRX89187.1 hypothetical protein [Steroidobacteraceae bacterium]
MLDAPVFTLVKFPTTGPALSRTALADLLQRTSARYQSIPGLRRKLFLSSEGVGGGWYEWASRRQAEAFYDDAWRSAMRQTYGVEPVVEYFAAPCIVDNDRGSIDYYLD